MFIKSFVVRSTLLLANFFDNAAQKFICTTTSNDLMLELTNEIHGTLQVVDIVLVIPLNQAIHIENALLLGWHNAELATNDRFRIRQSRTKTPGVNTKIISARSKLGLNQR